MSPTTSSWSFSPSPASNDSFTNRINLAAAPHWWTGGYNRGATRQSGEPVSSGERTVWYQMFLGHSGNITFRVDRTWGNLSNVVLTAYRGSSVGSLTLVAQDTGPFPSITFPNEWGIKICVGGVTTADEGGFSLSWDMAYAQTNYSWATATVLSGTSGTLAGQNSNGSMREYGDVRQTYIDGVDSALWYKHTAAADGFFDVSVTGSTNFEMSILRGATFETSELVQRVTSSPSFTGKAGTPVTAGETVYVEINGYQQSGGIPNVSFGWNFNTHVAANYYAAGELQFNALGYTTIDVNPDDNHRRRGDWHYVSFYVRLASASIPTSQTDPLTHWPIIAEALTPDGKTIWALVLNGGFQGDKFSGTLVLRVHDYDLLVGEWTPVRSARQVRDQPVHVEVVFQSPDSLSATDNFSKGMGQVYVMVDGSMAMSAQDRGVRIPSGGFRYLHLGQVTNPDSWPLDLRFTHIRALNMRTHKPPQPELSPNAKRIWKAQGFDAAVPFAEWAYYVWNNGDRMMDTGYGTNWPSYESWDGYLVSGTSASKYLDDTPGRGKGIRFIGNVNSNDVYPVARVGSPLYFPSLDWSWWVYVDAMPTSLTMIFGGTGVDFVGEPVSPYSVFNMVLRPDGTLILSCAGRNNTDFGEQVWAHRRVDVNTWVHLEVAVDFTDTRPVIHWWVNGEQQPDFSPNRTAEETRALAALNAISGPGWSRVSGAAPGGSCWVTDIAVGPYFGTPIGPLKSQLLKPASSGTHALGTPPTYYDGIPAPYAFFKTTDDGATSTGLGTTDAIHTLIDDWPVTVDGTSDFVGQASWGTGTYVEFGYDAVGGGETVVGVNAYKALRGYQLSYTAGYPIEHRYLGFTPSASAYLALCFWWLHDPGSGDNLAEGGVTSFLIGTDTLRRRYIETGTWTRGFGSQDWTPSMLNGAKGRWGERSGYPSGYDQAPDSEGVALLAQALEVFLVDAPPSLGANLSTPDALVWTDWHNDALTTKDSCVSEDPSDLATDPNMANAVFWYPILGTADWYENRRDVEWYWRVTPAQHKVLPGFDSNYHDTDADRLAGTTSHKVLMGDWSPFTYDFQDNWYTWPREGIVFKYPTIPDGSKWFHEWDGNYFGYGTTIAISEWIFDPCVRTRLGVIDANTRQVTIQAYARDSFGRTSPVSTITWTINQGTCCAVTGLKFHTNVTRRV